MTDQKPDVAAIEAELNRQKEVNQNLQGRLTDFEKKWGWTKDHDPEGIRAKLEDYDNLRKSATGGDKAAIDQLVAEKEKEIETRYSRKFGEYESENTNLKREVKNLRVTSVAMQEAAKFFNADGLPLLKPMIEANTDFIDGKIVVLENGKPRASIKDPRNAMDVGEWMETLTKDYPSIAKSNTVGAGKPNGTKIHGTGATLSVGEYSRLSASDQRSYLKGLAPDQQRALLNDLVKTN